MQKKTFRFNTGAVNYFPSENFNDLGRIVDIKNTVLVTDDHIFDSHEKKFTRWNTIVLKPGEEYKVQETADAVISQLLEAGADRKTILIGVGGGVITDITGYVASVYMRGIACGFVPTTLLAMVDASLGGKNGVNAGHYKNMVGTIRQPAFIFHDHSFLKTLPEEEWQNGFAEIIKHAAIRDAAMFRELEANDLVKYRRKKDLVLPLIRRNVLLKTKMVLADEFETGDRKLLNFGHTLGHALEKQYSLSHGEAISVGMTFASLLSRQHTGFKEPERVINLLEKYGLPGFLKFNKDKIIANIRHDKKKQGDSVDYILLDKIGRAVIKTIPFTELYEAL
jgi:3-dehydroquinate synthase